ncbi:MAG TPA: TonB-dependent receptor [Paucimonas sp.]|nr:TonB-dependent receptor [Paucimonas sp.]
MRLTELALSVALAFSVAPAFAQNTTSAIGGLVTSADGSPAAGAQVTIKHVESGSVSNVTTDATGRYTARGLRPGGPYTITVTKGGVTETHENVYLQLAETASLDAKLGAGQATATVTVTGRAASDRFNKSAMGAGTNIGRAELAALASIQRNLQDYARTDPRLSQTDKDRGEMSAAGQNFRYNSITIDGVAINDTFGLESNNLPTIKQPISIDAIQSVQVNVSNYDVTQKGYTGANINAVTKSGTNELHGSVYYVFRNDKLAGDRYNATTDTYSAPSPFKETTKGITLGGPIIKDKLFFFANYEEMTSAPSRTAPTHGPVGSSLTNVAISQSAISSLQSLAQSRYGMNVGGSDVPDGSNTSVKDSLIKLDWNINDDHRANLRYTKTEQIEQIFPGFGNTSLSLNSYWYNQKKTIETTVAQWFGDWTENFSTEVKVSQRDYHSEPNNNSNLPAMALRFSGALPAGAPSSLSTGNRFLNFGTERSRHFNVLDTKTLDAYFGANWAIGKHDVKFGADYTKNEIFNAFFQNTKGNYQFRCVDSSATWTYTFGPITCSSASAADHERAVLENFSRGRPAEYTLQAPNAGYTLNDAAAQYTQTGYGLFIQDAWAVTPALSILYGVRYDMTSVGSTPKANAAVAAPVVAGNVATNTRQTGGFGYDNTVTIDGKKLLQPRVGFNYKLDISERPTQLRGGIGLFEGAAANVWLANPFQNNGLTMRIVSCGTPGFGACPGTDGLFSADPANQPTTLTGAPPAANVDLVSPNLGQPSVWKANLAFEHELPFLGLVFGMEYLNTKTRTGINYQHLNLGPSTRTGKDGRELFHSTQGYNSNCWSATGNASTSGACAGNSGRGLRNSSYNNVFLATKTEKGGGDVITMSLQRPLRGGWGASFAYTYTNATEVSPLTSSTAESNWLGRASFHPNEDVASKSSHLVKDRVSATFTWQKAFFSTYKTTFGMFYEGRSGRPYSWTYSNDLNGDGINGNDLMYIPSGFGSGEVVFRGDTATSRTNEERFWAIVNANPELSAAKGGVVKRNSGRSAWVNSFDMRLSQEIPSFFAGHKAVFSLDFLNVGNMINKRWGRISEMNFSGASPAGGGQRRTFVAYSGLDAQGRYIYSMQDRVTEPEVKQNKGESQWAVQATVRYEF